MNIIYQKLQIVNITKPTKFHAVFCVICCITQIYRERKILMNGYRIHFIRHAITNANEEGRYIGITDSPISDRGRIELAQKLRDCVYPDVDKVYVSPMQRCIATASFIYPEGYARIVPEIREMNFGRFEGKLLSEIKDTPEYKQFIKGGLDNPAPGGESMRKVIERCYEGISFIIEDMMKNNYHSAAVVTHGGIIMNMLSCFGMPKYNPNEFACDFGEGFTVLVTAQFWQSSGCFEILGRCPYEKPSDDEGDDEYDDDCDEYDLMFADDPQ